MTVHGGGLLPPPLLASLRLAPLACSCKTALAGATVVRWHSDIYRETCAVGERAIGALKPLLFVVLDML